MVSETAGFLVEGTEPHGRPEESPIVLANRVLRLFVDHLLGEDMLTMPQDYTVLRVAFRKCGGSWDHVVHGDIV